MGISNSKIDAIIEDLMARHKTKTDQIRSLRRDAGQILRQIRDLESAGQCPSDGLQWSTAKPREPGTYYVRCDSTFSDNAKLLRVKVEREGRGLLVLFKHELPMWPGEVWMSEVYQGLEWAKEVEGGG